MRKTKRTYNLEHKDDTDQHKQDGNIYTYIFALTLVSCSGDRFRFLEPTV